jgi:hypothetical protein
VVVAQTDEPSRLVGSVVIPMPVIYRLVGGRVIVSIVVGIDHGSKMPVISVESACSMLVTMPRLCGSGARESEHSGHNSNNRKFFHKCLFKMSSNTRRFSLTMFSLN